MDYILQNPSQLGDHVRALRKAKGLTQKQLSVLLGVDQTRISDIEKHTVTVNVGQLLRLLTALDAQVVLRAPASASAPLKKSTSRSDW
jgi:HTH-type transcriptional regulator/antitoxin HipB